MAKPKEKTTICESGIIGLAFSPDKKRVAFSPNNHLVYIADCGSKPFDCTTWNIVATLECHDHPVTGVDWSPITSLILTSSQDRTAFVWKEDSTGSNTWSPQIVMLDTTVQKGVTSCCWSANGEKAYFGSASANVVVGTFDVSNNWWHCRAIDRHRSTVTALSPHPSLHTVLATGGTDSSVLLLSTHLNKLDGKNEGTKFGGLLAEVQLKAWIHSLAWTPVENSRVLAVATHDSRVSIVNFSSTATFSNPTIQTLDMNILPLRSLTFISASQLVGAGFDFYPVLFVLQSNTWKMGGKWIADGNSANRVKTEAELAREKFQNQASTGQISAVDLPTTKHKNTITSVVRLHSSDEAPTSAVSFATSSMDGRVEFWDLKSVIVEQ